MGLTTSFKASVCRLVRTHLGRNELGRVLGFALGVAGMAAAASAQSPLTTTFGATTIGAAGAQVYFDLNVRNPITITQLDANIGSAVGTAGTLSVYITAVGGTYVGNHLNAGAWTLVSSGSLVAAGQNVHTVCDVTDFNLGLGTYGVAVRYNGVQPLLTNSGVTNPTFSTEELVYSTGRYQGTPFTGNLAGANYIWNGSIYYVPYVVAASGACCHGNATCTFDTNANCAGVFQGANVACASVTCVQRGGCCNSTTGVCAVSFTGASGCPSGTTYLGATTAATACGNNPCAQGACCNVAGGCILSTATGCPVIQGPGTSGSIFQGAGTVCVPTNPCPQPGAPSNDECVNAIVLSNAGQSVTVLGNNALATPVADIVPAVCAESGRDVFYSFTPALTANYTLTTCNSVTLDPPHDTVLSIHTGCPANGSNSIACSDDDCTGGAAGPSTIPNAVFPTLTLTAGTTYIIRVATWHPTQPTTSGPFALTVTSEAIGVCCAPSGSCTLNVMSQCGTPNIFTAGLTTCSATFCSGACCNTATGACFVGGPGTCGAGSTFAGVNTTCTTNPCAGQACCNAGTGGCVFTGTNPCPAGTTSQGVGTACTPTNPCGEACCVPSGACTFTGLGTCPAGSTPQGVGTLCNPNNCPAPPVANDNCATATTLTAGAAPITGTTFGAVSDTTATCTTTILDVWYTFTAVAAGQYQVTVVNTNPIGPYNSSISIFSNCPAVTEVGCVGAAAPTSVLSIAGTAGTQYWVRVADFAGQPSPHTIQLNYFQSGACCNTTSGACTVTITGSAGCTGTTTFQGNGTVCVPSPCGEACCHAATGVCSTALVGGCPSGSTGQGLGSVCTPNPCVQPPAPSNDLCANAIALTLNVPVQSNNALATGDGTEGPGGPCYATSPTTFNRGVWYTFTAPATGGYLVSLCGTPFDTVLSVFSGPDCANLTSIACDDDTCIGTTDSPSPGPGPGSPLASVVANVALTAGTTYHIRAAAWAAGAGGPYGIVVQSNGVCCRGATCTTTVTTAAACTASLISGGTAGAAFPTGATCNVGNVSSTPCCYANYNKVNGVTVADIFDFLTDWFAGSPYANTGGNGTAGPLAVGNIFDFLTNWFNGGCN